MNLHILDNEITSTIKHAFKKNEVEFQLVPPNQHRQNTAEHAIRAFKKHLLVSLATYDSSFLIRE